MEISTGLCSGEATRRLCECLRAEVENENSRQQSGVWRCLVLALRRNPHSPVHWLSCLLLILMSLLLLVAFPSQQDSGRSGLLVFEGLFMIVMAAINILLGVWEEYLRQTEMTRKLSGILSDTTSALRAYDENGESPLYFPVLMPSCPSLSFIPTYRDGRLVNLPVGLLVEDDEVLMPPGTQAPVRMAQIVSGGGEDIVVLNRGDTFLPAAGKSVEHETIEHSHIVPWSRFRVKEAAATYIIKHSLAVSLNRPISVLCQEKHIFVIQLLSHRLVWIFLGISFVVNLLRLALLPDDVADWPEMVYVLQIYTVMPLLPLSFPLFWTVLRWYGTACVLTSFNYCRSQRDNSANEPLTPDFTPPDPGTDVKNGRGNANRKRVWQTLWEIVKGQPDSLSHTANILEGLGNVSVLSCADKEGVLCNPSPYPNKVFFFCSEDCNETASTDGNKPDDDIVDQDKSETDELPKARRVSWHEHKDTTINGLGSVACAQLSEPSHAVLQTEESEHQNRLFLAAGTGQLLSHSLISDESWLSHDELISDLLTSQSPSLTASQASPGLEVHAQVLDLSVISEVGTVRFDDPSWLKFLQSLKPLGLNILLNCANQSPSASLWRQSHVASLAAAPSKPSDSLERYLFTLGWEIGFTSTGLAAFQPLSSLSVFSVRTSWEWMRPPSRQAMEGSMSSSKWRSLSSQLQLSRQRPSMVGAMAVTQVMVSQIVKQVDSGSYQLLSRGPADLLLDQCVDFWDGYELRSLTAQERKRVMDFHRRSSLSGYCVALAYRPVDSLSGLTQDVYIDLPPSYHDDALEGSESPEDLLQSDASPSESDSINRGDSTAFLEKGPARCISVNPESCFRFQKGQVFIGMVSLQYQPKKDVVRLVEELDGAGIRFVHFSSDSELKSKVFAAKMGLETGWNCHISLAEDEEQEYLQATDGRESLSCSTGSRVDEIIDGLSQDTDLETVFMNYKARLPRGIKQVRPHLENVDNVPLQVSLFTDCTPHATQEMIEILQENGEVVCCIGSALNIENIAIFAQADVSFGLEPICPLPYSKTGSSVDGGDVLKDTFASLRQGTDCRKTWHHLPIWLACVLNSLPCSLVFHREDNIRIASLVHKARHITMSLRRCFLFLWSCLLTLTVSVTLGSLFFLPPLLSGLHIIWLSVVIAPLLSVSMLTVPANKRLMTTMTAKNKEHVRDLRRLSVYYIIGFVPQAMVVVLCFGLMLGQFCENVKETVFTNSSNHTCHPLLGMRDSASNWNGWGLEYVQSLALAQDSNSFLLALYFVFASLTFIERSKPLRKLRIADFKGWGICAGISFVLQIIYFSISTWAWSNAAAADMFTSRLSDIPVTVYVIGLFWPLPLLVVHELVKSHDRKIYARYQKRRKLEFQTKLGMNSPV